MRWNKTVLSIILCISIFTLFLISSFFTPVTPHQDVATVGPDANACQVKTTSDYSLALESVVSNKFEIILVGEAHGNLQSIEFVREFLLHYLNRNEDILFLYEAPQEDGFGFDKYFNQALPLATVLTSLSESVFWGKNTDGRQSCGLLTLLVDIANHPNVEKLDFLLLSPTHEERSKGGLKGHIMAEKLHAHRLNRPDIPTIAITGRNYQRVSSHYSLDEQSTMCGKVKQKIKRRTICIATVGLSLPREEVPCGSNEAFDLLLPTNFESGFYKDFDAVLSSKMRCSDYTGLAFTRRR